jgi:hypothetical protein
MGWPIGRSILTPYRLDPGRHLISIVSRAVPDKRGARGRAGSSIPPEDRVTAQVSRLRFERGTEAAQRLHVAVVHRRVVVIELLGLMADGQTLKPPPENARAVV